MALDALVEILQKGEERNRVACAKEILDRGHGRSVQAIDLVLMGRKITELSKDELLALDAMFVSAGAVSVGNARPGGRALMPGLREMIRGGLIRREAATSVFLPFHFVVHDEPAAVSDAALATKAIEGERDNRADRRASVVITPGIQEAVETALAARYPMRFSRAGLAIIVHMIVEPPMRAGQPDVAEPTGLWMGWSRRAAPLALAEPAETVSANAGSAEPPPLSAVERVAAALEQLFLAQPGPVTDLLDQLRACSPADLARLFGPPPSPEGMATERLPAPVGASLASPAIVSGSAGKRRRRE